MFLTRARKSEIVEDTKTALESSTSVIVADYSGITVNQFTQVRRQARDEGVKLSVVRNNLIRRALEGSKHTCIEESLQGPVVLAFSQENPSAGARLLKNVMKELPELEIKGISLEGRWVNPNDLDRVASVPTKEEAIARLLSVMTAPVGKLAQVLNAVPSKLVRTLVAVKDQKSSET
ncbi:MAG: 50S ribosomal protein L10 [Gammaproteobacteria bacterium]|nr:50S ribosomal protein L10 [Gammaproteobacteria bacterium]